jgi:hypothetical protein
VKCAPEKSRDDRPRRCGVQTERVNTASLSGLESQTGENAMKLAAVVLCLVGSAMAGNAAFAQAMNADDVKWINQCIADNKGGASETVVRKYCICMNEKMSSNETRSITEWEKANPAARAACDRESGWR